MAIPNTNGNGRKPWGEIRRIDAEEMLPRSTGGSIYLALWRELLLRLEQTPATYALEITFDDHQEGYSALSSLRRIREQQGKVDQVELSSRKLDDKRVIYIRRGKGYKKSAGAKDAD